ncbi:chaperonin 10-like protein [Podospora appendiculata]|uniref:Chaperonin 10-like protein n=1 Tax=Podospora appendiculata TaxID=314037 RepID=A0AAE1C7M5_9PEZI|nr:chaperonin 10-like protein [Podospora appendiculata]
MSTSDTVTQYQLLAKNGAFARASVPRPVPGPTEVSFRTRAVALNPADWKQRAWGFAIETWPAVLGLEAAGVVEAVGEQVTAVQVGDEVFGSVGFGGKAAAFQEVVTVDVTRVGRKPKGLSFEDAVSLPLGFGTAASAVVKGLQIPLRTLLPPADSTPRATPLRSVLVLGGSSAVGAAAIQILRIAQPELTIFATSSAQHHARLLSLGADKAFDRATAQADPAEIIAAAPGGEGVDAILDAVGAGGEQLAVFGALRKGGPGLYVQVFTGKDLVVPEGVEHVVASTRFLWALPGGGEVLTLLAGLVDEGRYALPVEVEVVGTGFKAIPGGLDRLQAGLVSGRKLVVSI